MIPLILYIAIFVAAFFIVTKVAQGAGVRDYTSLKTVTFGDESAVRPNRAAGIGAHNQPHFMVRRIRAKQARHRHIQRLRQMP